jgi:hypothetical protein
MGAHVGKNCPICGSGLLLEPTVGCDQGRDAEVSMYLLCIDFVSDKKSIHFHRPDTKSIHFHQPDTINVSSKNKHTHSLQAPTLTIRQNSQYSIY